MWAVPHSESPGSHRGRQASKANAYIIGSDDAGSTQPPIRRDTYVDGQNHANTASISPDNIAVNSLDSASFGPQPHLTSHRHNSGPPRDAHNQHFPQELSPQANYRNSTYADSSPFFPMIVPETDHGLVVESPSISPAKSPVKLSNSSSQSDPSEQLDTRKLKHEDDDRGSSATLSPTTIFQTINMRRTVPKHNDAGKFECQTCHQIFDRKCEWK